MPIARTVMTAIQKRRWRPLSAGLALLMLGVLAMPAGPWWQQALAIVALIWGTEIVDRSAV